LTPEARRWAGGRLVIMDSGLPDSLLGRLLGPATRALSRVTFLGDPHTRPWIDLEDLGAKVECDRFAPGIYFLCSASKPYRGTTTLDRTRERRWFEANWAVGEAPGSFMRSNGAE
jgi:hypothetical protein